MRLFVRNIYIIIGVVLFTNCSKYDKKMPIDFSFIIEDNHNKYNSQTGIYTRRYREIRLLNIPPTSSIKVELTQKELNLIYESFKKYDFLCFPEEFKCSEKGTSIFPFHFIRLKITYKGITKKVNNSTHCSDKIEQRKSDEFDEFSYGIMSIINSKQQIINMKESNIIEE